MNVTYEIDSLSQADNYNDLYTYLNNEENIGKKPHKKPGHCDCDPNHKHCHCHDKDKDSSKCKCNPKKTEKEIQENKQQIKKTQKEVQNIKTQVLKEVQKIIGEGLDLNIEEIVDAVIQKQKPHEDNQTNNINKNQQDINDLNNITIWDNTLPF